MAWQIVRFSRSINAVLSRFESYYDSSNATSGLRRFCFYLYTATPAENWNPFPDDANRDMSSSLIMNRACFQVRIAFA
jgi:hypothetical protein